MSTVNPNPTGISILPREIFWMVLGNLEPRDVIRCRRVSRAWNVAFREPANLLPLMRKWFPLAKEVRELVHHHTAKEGADERDESVEDGDSTGNYIRNNGNCECGTENPLDGGTSCTADIGDYWRQKFDLVACRYEHLTCGKPRSTRKYRLCDDFGSSGEREWFPVQPWESHASHLMQRVDCQFSETFWTYEDGLLVYPSADHQCLVLMDLECDRHFMVPFIITGKVVRRVRLQKMVLVVEWAEPKAFHWLNESDGVHRHFASCFDVERNSTGGWSVTPRNEWKIMFLGHPLSDRDRFFSTHTKTHYVVYIWQPNRSLYTADDDAPIESLMVWDISKPSSYRPSLDPTGSLRVEGQDTGPSIVTRFGFRELGFFSVRQRGLPGIQRLEITDDGQAIEITENLCTGPMDRLVGPAEWTSEVQITSVPLIGEGPVLRRSKTGLALPPYRGNGGLQTPPLAFAGSVGLWYTIVSETFDEQAQVGLCLHLSAFMWPFDLRLLLSIRTPTSDVTLKPEDVFEIAGKGKICGNERYVVGENDNRELVVFRFDR